MTEPTQAQITEAVKLKFKFAKGPVIYGGELAELIAHIRRTPRPQGSTMKPDWHDRPTEPGLWLVHAKGSRTDVMACTIVTDEMMACIDEAIDADIRYCGPYALPPDTKEEKC